MKTIENVLNTFLGEKRETEKIIKNITLDEKLHKVGIVNIGKAIDSNFTIDDDNKQQIRKLFYYFTGNESQCELNGIDLNKSLLIVGNPGSGKSILMQIFKIYTGEILRKNSFHYFNASEIIEEVGKNGISFFEKFNHNFNGNKADPLTCYIDDIASKTELIKHFGTEINVISELINIRYLIFQRYKKLTHFSSNIYPSEMSGIYDPRIISRLIEMCNIIELSGDDRRIK